MLYMYIHASICINLFLQNLRFICIVTIVAHVCSLSCSTPSTRLGTLGKLYLAPHHTASTAGGRWGSCGCGCCRPSSCGSPSSTGRPSSCGSPSSSCMPSSGSSPCGSRPSGCGRPFCGCSPCCGGWPGGSRGSCGAGSCSCGSCR